MQKITIAYIANGKSTNRYHLPFVLQLQDRFQVKTIYARHLEKTEWKRVDGIRYTDKIEDIYEDPDIDLVVICTPAPFHYTYVKEVLSHNKHCVCEKPFMETEAQAKECFSLAKEKGLLLECYQNRRFDSDFLTVQKVIASKVLGDIQEVELSFDYYRPKVPAKAPFSRINSFYYGHACHTLDQVISYWGKPEFIHYDVRQLLGEGHMNDYFDLDLYYAHALKVSIHSSYFRLVPRPSFIVYGTKGRFIKETKDLQERNLKRFYMPEGHQDFGKDTPAEYGTVTYIDSEGIYHEEKVPSVQGGYEKYYEALYETLVCHKAPLVTEEQTLLQLHYLEEGMKGLQ